MRSLIVLVFCVKVSVLHLTKFTMKLPWHYLRLVKKKGVKKVIQISAIGNHRDTAFISSKYKADAQLQTLDLDWVITAV